MQMDKGERYMKRDIFNKRDTEVLIQARILVTYIHTATYKSSSRKSALLDTVVSKLDRLLKGYGTDKEVDAYFGKIYEDSKNNKC